MNKKLILTLALISALFVPVYLFGAATELGTVLIDDTSPVNIGGTVTVGSSVTVPTDGDVSHDASDTTSPAPVKLGHRAVDFGANQTGVQDDDRTNWYSSRAGVPFILGGHMNPITREYLRTTAGTDTALVTVSAGAKIVVTKIGAYIDDVASVSVALRCGFGTAVVPALPADGATVDGIVLTHPSLQATLDSKVELGTGGSILGVGADDEDLRCTNTVPTGGEIRVLVTFFTVEG